MADRKYEDVLEDIRTGELSGEDAAKALEPFKTSSLREEASKAARERDEWKTRAEKAERAPVRDKAFKDSGVDLDSLKPLERQAIENYEGELTEEALEKFITANELSTAPSSGGGTGETPASGQVAAAARQAPSGGSGGRKQGGGISRDDMREWSAEKTARFEQEFGEEMMDRILEGETVYGLTFS